MTDGPARAPGPGPVWRSPGMPALVAATASGFSGYAVLLPVAPMWAVDGGADTGGAGLVNGVLLLCTVLTQPFVPLALRRLGWGPVLAIGLLLLGVPALAHALSAELPVLLGLSAVRGVGFGVLTVTGSAATAELVPPARRGAAIGVYGLAIAGPQVVLLPLGPVLAERVGYLPVFVVAALPLLGIAPALALGRHLARRSAAHRDRADDQTGPAPSSAAHAATRLLRPMCLLLGVTLAGGAIITFAPQMLGSGPVVAAALALMGLTSALTRWRLGALADRHGAETFIWPLVVLTVASMGLAALAVRDGSAALFLVAVTLLGGAYGGLQNLTLVAAFAAVHPRHVGLASSVWNVGFDLGTGLGSVLLGVVAVRAGFPAGLLVAAVVAALTLPLALRRPAGPVGGSVGERTPDGA